MKSKSRSKKKREYHVRRCQGMNIHTSNQKSASAEIMRKVDMCINSDTNIEQRIHGA
jgi:hypothetical protein